MKFTSKVHVKAPVETVFEVFSDLEHAAGRIEGIKRIELLTPGPMKVGTRWRETRIMFKREATEEMWITAFERNKNYSAAANSCGCAVETHFQFQPQNGGTDVEVKFHWRAMTLFAKLMSPLSLIMAGSCKKLFEKDLEDLRRHIETKHAKR